MSNENTHQEARKAIRWLQIYFESLRKWIAAVDEVCTDRGWMMFEPNRASTALGNGYRDNTQWVMNWIARHYYQNGSDKSLLIHLPLAAKTYEDEDRVYCYVSHIQHPQVAPEEGIPSFSRDWTGTPIVNGMREQETNTWVRLEEQLARKALKGTLGIAVCKIPMVEFGDSAESVRQKLEGILDALGNGEENHQGF